MDNYKSQLQTEIDYHIECLKRWLNSAQTIPLEKVHLFRKDLQKEMEDYVWRRKLSLFYNLGLKEGKRNLQLFKFSLPRYLDSFEDTSIPEKRILNQFLPVFKKYKEWYQENLNEIVRLKISFPYDFLYDLFGYTYNELAFLIGEDKVSLKIPNRKLTAFQNALILAYQVEAKEIKDFRNHPDGFQKAVTAKGRELGFTSKNDNKSHFLTEYQKVENRNERLNLTKLEKNIDTILEYLSPKAKELAEKDLKDYQNPR